MADSDPFVARLLHDALGLMEEARSFMAVRRDRDQAEYSQEHALALTSEYMRVSTRLMQATCWLIAQRGVANGEITAAEACSERFAPGTPEVCLAPSIVAEDAMPRGLASLLERSLSVYQRTTRLCEQARATLAAAPAQ